jgi:hypothetical protein
MVFPAHRKVQLDIVYVAVCAELLGMQLWESREAPSCLRSQEGLPEEEALVLDLEG